jgi:hypothetical protein
MQPGLEFDDGKQLHIEMDLLTVNRCLVFMFGMLDRIIVS